MKRYNTPQQVLDDVERFKTKAQKLTAEAESLECKCGQILKSGDPTLVEDAIFAKEMAKKLRRQAARIMEKKLPHLKSKLSEILTPQLPNLDDGDPSIKA